MKWRLGLDLGTNSLGWAVLGLASSSAGAKCTSEINEIIDAGVRIFSDGRNPKDKQSNAVKRREPRSARRNRDRSKNRQARLMRELIEYGLMPKEEAGRKKLEGGKGISQLESDPWILRARALDEEISIHQLGRVIFHLSQRRGFKSNRKTDRASNEKGKVNEAIKRTQAQLEEEGARTLGEFFGARRLAVAQENSETPKGMRQAQPLARVRKSGDGAKWQYDYYPTRELILDEFDKIWQAQSQHHAELNDDAFEIIRGTLEFQWPLKAQPVGKCTFLPNEPRAAKALPSFQRNRIFQEVNNLRIRAMGGAERALSLEERDILAAKLLHPTNKSGTMTFGQIRKALKLSQHDTFSLESEKRKVMDGDKTAAVLMQADRWGEAWFELSLENQNEIVTKLIEVESETEILAWLHDEHGFEQEAAEYIADAPIPDGYGNLSKIAIDKILPLLESDVTRYDEAATQAFGDHANFATGELHDLKLPYYGIILSRSVAFGTGELKDIDEKRYGKIANPTVHVALNQVRVVVNDLIKRFGAPEQIVVEVARDLPLSAKGKIELNSDQAKNQRANEARKIWLEDNGQVNNYENRMRLRLYEEMEALAKQCVFTGEQISRDDLFNGTIQIEHLLPKSQTFDDGIGNKILCTHKANMDKGNRSPFEAFGHNPAGYNWDEISVRVAHSPRSKQWRFGSDAMDKFKDEGSFMDRQLNNTRYIARLTKGYLEAIYGGAPKAGGKQHVWVVPGKLTSDLRYHWNLDSVLRGHNEQIAEAQKKNRNDHRHHAIDAIVVGMTDRSLVKAASDLAKQNHDMSMRLFDGLQEPWNGFRDEVRDVIQKITVSHKPDHGFQGAMHNDTAYGIPKGIEGEPDKKGVRTVVTRKPLDGGFSAPKDLQKIRDYDIKMALLEVTKGLSGSEFKSVLIKTGEEMQPPVRRVRIEEKLKIIEIADRKTGKIYKGYKGDSNYCYDIWLDVKGKWTGEVISTFQAYQLGKANKEWWRQLKRENGNALIMRLRKNDFLEIEHDDRTIIVQISGLSKGIITLVEHFEANVDARVRDSEDELKYIFKRPSSLQKSNAKRVTVSPAGVVKRYN